MPEEDGSPDIYESLAEVERRKREKRERLEGRRFVPTEDELLEEVESWREDDHPPVPTTRQVGVRLRPAQWDRLVLVAEWAGIRPTTMARLLINRGARAIIDEELRYRRTYGSRAE